MIQDATGLNSTPLELFVVIVLYKMKPSESPSLRTLQAAIACLPHEEAKIRILLYDNTPGGQRVDIPEGMEYVADPENGGLAKAYNYALEIAAKNGFDWLLTLDQDSNLPADFVSKVCHTAAFVEPLSNVAAIVPCILGDGRVRSPLRRIKHRPVGKFISKDFIGVADDNTLAVNSASVLRVSALKSIGGYDLRYGLDQSDIVMYHHLHCNNFRVFVAGNIRVNHELSHLDLENRCSLRRYESILFAEEAFCDEYLGIEESVLLALKIFYRMAYRVWRTGGSYPYAKICLKYLCRRLLYSRKKRMKDWDGSSTSNSSTKGKNL